MYLSNDSLIEQIAQLAKFITHINSLQSRNISNLYDIATEIELEAKEIKNTAEFIVTIKKALHDYKSLHGQTEFYYHILYDLMKFNTKLSECEDTQCNREAFARHLAKLAEGIKPVHYSQRSFSLNTH